MEAQNGAHVVLGLVHHVLVVGVHQEGQGDAVGAQGGLDDVGDIVLVLLLVEVGHVLAGGVLVGGQVEVGAGGHAPQLAPAEGEDELKVGGGVGVVGELLRVVVAQPQVLVPHAQVQQPLVAEVLPVGEPVQLGAGGAEELQLHLLKLAGAEGEVARGDLVAEGLADLAHAEGQFSPGGALDVLEVDKDALGGLRAQVHGVLGVLGDALEGLEHQVELADVGPVVLAAGGAGDVVLLHELLHLGLGHGVHAVAQLEVILLAPVLDDLVGAEALLALLAVHQRIGEAAHVAGGHPHLGVHQDGRV